MDKESYEEIGRINVLLVGLDINQLRAVSVSIYDMLYDKPFSKYAK